jgi:hypothetical protein
LALPNLFIIGAAKAGTTSLHHYLDLHPEVQMSPVKEPNFFSGPPGEIPYPAGRVASLDEYEQLFDPAYPVRGEASVGYSNFPRRRGVPAAIRERVPAARIVYVVRDPIARILSQYQYRVAMEGERRPLDEALEDVGDPLSVYLCPSRYATQLELYLEAFPPEQVLVLDHAVLLADRDTALREVFAFLGVSADVDYSEFEEELNSGAEKREFSTGYVRVRERLKQSPLRLVPRGLRRSLAGVLERSMWSPVPPASLEEPVRQRLEEALAPETARLRAMTGQDFATWSV